MRKKIGKLAALVEGAKVIGNADTFITDIVQDSRQATKGAMFVCVAGEHVDGHKFIPDVKAKGAVAIVTERDIEPPQGIVVLKVPNLDEALQIIVPYFFDIPSQRVRLIGITGTNGKTTTSFLLRSILRHAGHKVGLIGTIQTLIEPEYDAEYRRSPAALGADGRGRHRVRRDGGLVPRAGAEPRRGLRVRYRCIHELHAGPSRLS